MVHYLSPPSASPSLQEAEEVPPKERKKDGSSDGKDEEKEVEEDEVRAPGPQGFTAIPSDIPKELAYVPNFERLLIMISDALILDTHS